VARSILGAFDKFSAVRSIGGAVRLAAGEALRAPDHIDHWPAESAFALIDTLDLLH
jgi:hypothetical protein